MKKPNKKKTVKRILAAVMLLLVLFWTVSYAVTLFMIPHRYEGPGLPASDEGQVRFINDGTGTPYLAKFDSQGNMLDASFKVISTTDFHLSYSDAQQTLDLLAELIDTEKPDLVVLLGDLILAGDTVNQELLKSFFDERQQYWTFVPGNHDGEDYNGTQDRDELRRWWYESMLGSEYCISFDEGGDEVYGFGNHAVNIRTKSGITQTLFFLDNSVNCPADSPLYDSQLRWYESRVEEIRQENGGKTVPSAVYMHRPVEEYQTAWDALENGGAERVYGDIMETIEYGGYNWGLFAKAKELGSTHSFICGHEHYNDICMNYEGINLIYSQGLHFAKAYSRAFALRWHFLYLVNRNCNWFAEGATAMMIYADGSTEIAPVYLPEESYVDYLN